MNVDGARGTKTRLCALMFLKLPPRKSKQIGMIRKSLFTELDFPESKTLLSS